MTETKKEYLKRINFILDYIENNLDAELSLKILSEKSYYSPYHFHRVFLTIVNERLNEYITRKRLERIASILLVKPNSTLKNLAHKYGFNTDNSFSRSFKKYYGVSPTEFKSKGKIIISKIGIVPFSSEKYICSIEKTKQWMDMNSQITIKELSEIKLASISHIGEFKKAETMFQKLMEWGHSKKVLNPSHFKAVTVYHDNPNITHGTKIRFSAGVTISKDINPDGEIRQLNLRKGIHIVGHFEIKTDEISYAWKSMCIWVIENGYEFRDGDYFETYHNDHTTHPEKKFIIDICIPIVKTNNIELGKVKNVNFAKVKKCKQSNENQIDYHQLINYMKELKTIFHNEYDTYFKLGNIYKGSPNFSYFSLTPEALKNQKLKFVIVLDHKKLCFSICLSGQNKSVRKKYWTLFKGSDWNKYQLIESIDDSLSIVDHIIIENSNFENKLTLTELIKNESLEFINDFTDILE